jgi:hypothetical protein
VLIGGDRAQLSGDLAGGYYIQPTLFKGHNKMRIFQEEIFGPVLAVTTFKDEAEALAIANDTLYGLGAGVWTRDGSRAYRMGRAIQAGRVWTNCYHAYPAHAAFGGYKESGIGRETHKAMLDHYQQTKNLLVSYGHQRVASRPAAGRHRPVPVGRRHSGRGRLHARAGGAGARPGHAGRARRAGAAVGADGGAPRARLHRCPQHPQQPPAAAPGLSARGRAVRAVPWRGLRGMGLPAGAAALTQFRACPISKASMPSRSARSPASPVIGSAFLRSISTATKRQMCRPSCKRTRKEPPATW